jgi:hypothetical protein
MTYIPPLNGGRINVTIGGNTAGAGALASTGTVMLAGGNNVTLSQNANAITISGGAVGGVSNLGNTLGNTGTDNNALVFAGAGNITLSQSTDISGATVTVDDGGPVMFSYYNPQDAYQQVAGQQGQATLHVQPTPAPNVSFDRVVFPMVFSGATNSTARVTLSMWMGIYTRNDSTLSLSTSFSASQALTHSGTQNSSQNVGLKLYTMGASASLSEGPYYVGIVSRSTTAVGNASISQILASQQNSNLAGFWGQSPVASIQYTRGLGTYSVTTAGMPNSIGFSQLTGSGSNVLRQPMFYLVNGTV